MIPIFSGPNMHGPNLQRSEFTGTHIALVVFNAKQYGRGELFVRGTKQRCHDVGWKI